MRSTIDYRLKSALPASRIPQIDRHSALSDRETYIDLTDWPPFSFSPLAMPLARISIRRSIVPLYQVNQVRAYASRQQPSKNADEMSDSVGEGMKKAGQAFQVRSHLQLSFFTHNPAVYLKITKIATLGDSRSASRQANARGNGCGRVRKGTGLIIV